MSDERPRAASRTALWTGLFAILIFLVAFGAADWRLDQAPDLFTDEILYTRAAIRLAGEHALVWDRGEPIYVHPPLYFLAGAIYWQLTNHPAAPLYAAGDIFAAVYHLRTLNILFAGLTASLLYLLGRRLHGHGLGLLFAMLFILDPFGLRINRRAMLETMAVLLSLAGMAVLLSARPRPDPSPSLSRGLWAGLLLGAALLTKELAFISLLAVLLLGLWSLLPRRGARRHRSGQAEGQNPPPADPFAPVEAFLAVGVAALTYSIYPLWMLTSGNWSGFVQVKSLSLQRLLGLVQISGWNRPGASLVEMLEQRLADYGSSYLLLALGGLATLWLVLKHRHSRLGRLLGLWGAVLYPFFGFLALFGSGNDQFFYFLLVPAIVLLGYAATVRPALAARVRLVQVAGVALLLALLLPYNLARWWQAYGVGVDNGYRLLASYVEEHLPGGEPLNASGDAIKAQYFYPGRPIASAATPEEARALGVHYFVLAPKDVQVRYGRLTPELAAWISAEGKLLYTVHGDSYGQISLYRVDYGPVKATTVPPAEAAARQRSFAPAESGFTGSFFLALGLWALLLGGLALWLGRRRVRSGGQNSSYRRLVVPAPVLEAEREHP